MPKGSSDIPDLRLVVLRKTIESFMSPPNLLFINRFRAEDNESDSIEWETVTGSRGMTPFAAPGSRAKETSLDGHGAGRAMAAYWKEKLFYDEQFLNNLRQVGTRQVYMPAAKRLARDEKILRNRQDRRKEWMLVQMFTQGGFSYLGRGEVKVSVDYGVPATHKVTLEAAKKWDTGSSKDIVQDIFDIVLFMQNGYGAKITNMIFTTEILNILVLDNRIQALLSKSAFGTGDLLTRPLQVLSALFNIPTLELYDEQHQVKAWLTAAVTANSTTNVYVDDTSDFEVGGTLRINDVSARTYDEATITAISHESGYITIDAAVDSSYKAGEDNVTMTKKFLDPTKVLFYCDSVEGDRIAGYYNAPFGLARNYGMKVKRWDDEDPEGTWVMTENKGLPCLFRPEGVYVLTVR